MHHVKTLRSLVILLAVAQAAPAALAQKVTFEPSLDLGRGYSDNLAEGGTATSDPNETRTPSDSVVTIRLLLPVTREWRTGRLDFRYEPSFTRYDKRDDLDRDEHKLNFVLRGEPERGTKYGLIARFRSTQFQGDSTSTDDADLFLSQRTDRQIAGVDFTTQVRLGTKWNWDLGLGGSLYNYDTLGDFTGASTNSQVEDRVETRGAVSFSRNLRATGADIGVQFVHAEYDLDVSEDAAQDAVRLVFNRRIGRRASASLALGAFQIDSDSVDDDLDRTGLDVNAALTRPYRRVRLTLSGRRAPSSGGALLGTSTNTLLGLSLGSMGDSPWQWRVSPRFAEREPTDRTSATRRTITVGGELSRRIARQMRLRLRANQIDQTANDSNIPDRRTFTAEFAVQWFPRGGA